MVEEQSKQIQHELPRNFRELPILESGIPRVYEIAEGIVSIDPTIGGGAYNRLPKGISICHSVKQR